MTDDTKPNFDAPLCTRNEDRKGIQGGGWRLQEIEAGSATLPGEEGEGTLMDVQFY